MTTCWKYRCERRCLGNQSQFYILLNPAPQLDGTHVVFGCIEEGLQVLRWLEKLETADQDR